MYANLFFRGKKKRYTCSSVCLMFIYTVFCFIIYAFTVSGLLSVMLIYFFLFFFFFIMTEKYICPKRSSVIYCEVICYHVVKCESSASCKLHFPELYKCLSMSILYHRCLFHTYLHVSLCLFIGKKMETHRKNVTL